MNGFKDVKGNNVGTQIRAIIDAKGQGFLRFWFFRLGQKDPSEKISYVKLYEKWNWIAGTGYMLTISMMTIPKNTSLLLTK